MRNSSTALVSSIHPTQTAIGQELARRGVDMILAVEDGNALLQCQVSSATAARMLAPLKGKAVGQFRPLSANIVEIDALVTVGVAIKMLAARDAAILH
jgi:hypothetical protein